jgi:hypothetical protein
MTKVACAENLFSNRYMEPTNSKTFISTGIPKNIPAYIKGNEMDNMIAMVASVP